MLLLETYFKEDFEILVDLGLLETLKIRYY